MDVYGLTGGIGSGKSTVATLLEEYGVPVVSADELSRVVVAAGSEGLRAVVEAFGPDVVDERGELDRRKMAGLVFRNSDRRRELEALLHPRIRDRFEQVLDALEKAGHEVCVYEVPLLFERNLQGEMKAVILVTARMEDRIARVRARDDVTETEVRARIATQMDEDQKRRRADYIIENTGNIDDLRREVEFLLARFLRVGRTLRRPGEGRSQAGTLESDLTFPPGSSTTLPGDEQPPSSRPTAVPTEAPMTNSTPIHTFVPEVIPGPPTVVDTGPPPRARADTIHPVTPASVPPPPPPAASPPPPPPPPSPVVPPPPPVASPPPPPPPRPSERPTVEVDAVAEDQRITRIDTGPPRKG